MRGGCLVVGCLDIYYSRGFCRKHYSRFKRYGDPIAGKASSGTALTYIKDVVLNHANAECLLWPFPHKRRYPEVFVEGRSVRANRYVCQIIHGPSPTIEHQAAHSCGNAHCLNPNHLRWATCLENMKDKEKHGTKLLGERNPKARLSREDVLTIRSLEGKVPAPELARRYGVTYENILRIHKRATWRWLEEEESSYA